MPVFPVVGITGGVGCGKSEVGRILAELGVAVLDADEVVHGLFVTGSPVATAVLAHFGSAVATPEGGVDRARLGSLVFADAAARRALEALVHPPVLVNIRKWREQAKGMRPAAALIPLLFEVGFTEGWDAVWCVSAEPGIVQQRLLARGWSAETIAARQAAQWPLAEKEKRADAVIYNNGRRDELAAAVQQMWMKLAKRSE